MDFAVPADHRVKLKESEKRDKYLDLAREREGLIWYQLTKKKKKPKLLIKLILQFQLTRVEMKASETIDKYMDLKAELKKPSNMKMTVIPNTVSALVSISHKLGKSMIWRLVKELKPSRQQHYENQ